MLRQRLTVRGATLNETPGPKGGSFQVRAVAGHSNEETGLEVDETEGKASVAGEQ